MSKDPVERMKVAYVGLDNVCQIIESLIDGHVLEHHARETLERLREILDSDSDPGSIRNMIRALETAEGTPGWTRPMDSVKNVYRKVL